MKKWLRVVATLALAICAVVLINVQGVNAADRITSTDGQWEYEADYFNSTCTVTDYFGDAVDLVIPSKIDGLKVTSISTKWCSSALSENTESISIPDTVTSIGASSFSGFSNLRTVKLPTKLETIREYAFLGCSSLEEITIPKSVSSIGEKAFKHSGIKKVVVEGNPEFRDFCFDECTNLEYVSMPEYKGSDRYYKRLFYDCTSLKEVNMPKIQVISDKMFYNCTSLEKIKLPSCLRVIGAAAFYNTSLKKVDLPSSLTSLCDYAFAGTKISELVMPYSLSSAYTHRIGTGVTNADIYVLNPYIFLDEVSQTCTIHGFKNSKAYESAKRMGVRFVEIKGGISSAKGKKSGTKSVLSWKKAKGAKTYTIYRYNDDKEVWQKIATTKKTKYTDKSKSASDTYKIIYQFKQDGKTLTGAIVIDI